MMNSESDIAELQKLQREASERRSQRDKERAAPGEVETQAAAEEPVKPEAESPITTASDSAGGGSQAELPPPGLSEQIESVLEELEEAASERPVLALLAAFSMGVIVGQLFSRR